MGQVAGAKIELDRLIASMQDARTSIPAEITGQQAELAGLISQIATASAADLPALKRAVSTAVAAAANAAQMQAGTSSQAGPSLADASEASRRSVQSALDYARTLDLQFASAEDESAYRQREAERRAYIEAQQAKGTPEGNLNAAGATVGQMADAKAHGAGGPEFDSHVADLLETTTRLRDAIRRSGKSTKEFDDRLREDLRRIMRSKGMTDTEIDAKFAANPDPLDAAKAYLTDRDVDAVKTSIVKTKRDLDREPSSTAAAALPSDGIANAADAMAELRAAGVIMSDASKDADPSHGVAVAVASARGRTTA